MQLPGKQDRTGEYKVLVQRMPLSLSQMNVHTSGSWRGCSNFAVACGNVYWLFCLRSETDTYQLMGKGYSIYQRADNYPGGKKTARKVAKINPEISFRRYCYEGSIDWGGMVCGGKLLPKHSGSLLPLSPKFMSTAINIMAQRKVLPVSTDEEVCFGRFS